MTLGFSTKWPDRMGELAGQPNYFIEKIWASMPDDLNRNTYLGYGSKCRDVLRECWDGYYDVGKVFKPKLHTIRRDSNTRWKEGNDIHFVINNRTKNRFQFAPVLKCKGVQKIEIKDVASTSYPNDFSTKISITVTRGEWTETFTQAFSVKVDGIQLSQDEVIRLAINDGFDSAEDFFAYFNKDFKGKLIHWTGLKY